MGRNLTNLYISQSFQFLTQISGSELQTGLGDTITGSLLITASKADTATSASFAATATSASFASTATSASFASTATSASFASTATSASQATSASFAITASFALNAGTTVSTASLLTTASATANVITFTKGDGSTFPVTIATGSAVSASFATTASLALNNVLTSSTNNDTITFTKGDGTTYTNVINNVSASISASRATSAASADTATTASYVLNAVSASRAVSAATADTATTASYVLNAVSASYAVSASQAQNAISSSYALSASQATNATTASFALNITGGLSPNFNNVTASNVLITGTASVALLHTTTISSSVIFSSGSNLLGDNATLDTQTLIGIVKTSGSFSATGSAGFTGGDFKVTDQNHNGEFDVDLFKVQTQTGTQFTGSVSSQNGFTGSLAGTASYANNALSSSYAVSASQAQNAVSASYAPASSPFPFTGSAIISGSLTVTGSVLFNEPNMIVGGPTIENMFIGPGSGKAITTGTGNTAIGPANTVGQGAGKGLTSGVENTFIGYRAGNGSTTAARNVAIGHYTMNDPASNNDCVYIGASAGQGSGGADKNVGIGYQAGYINSGDNNVQIGYQAGFSNLTGDNHILIGHRVGGQGIPYFSGSALLAIGNNPDLASNLLYGNHNENTLTNRFLKVNAPQFYLSGSLVSEKSSGSYGTGNNDVIFFGRNNILGNDSNNSIFVGSSLNLGSNLDNSAVVGGIGQRLNYGYGYIFGGSYNYIGYNSPGPSGNVYQGMIVGGSENTLNGNQANNMAIFGGQNNEIYATSSVAYSFAANSAILGGRFNKISGSQVHNSAIISSYASLINDYSSSVIIGGQNITASAHNTVYVPNLIFTGSLIREGSSTSTYPAMIIGSGSGRPLAVYMGGGINPTFDATESNTAMNHFIAGGTQCYTSMGLNNAWYFGYNYGGTPTVEFNANNYGKFYNGLHVTGGLQVSGAVVGNVLGNDTDTYTSSAAVQQVVTLTQAEYNAIGSPNANTLYIISGSTPINTSAFATTGSNTFVGNQTITGSVTATTGFTGSLLGTASFATSASYALSSSFATTASFASNFTIPTLQQVTTAGATTNVAVTINNTASADYWMVDTKPFAQLSTNTIVAGRIDGADEDFVLAGRNYTTGTANAITMTDGEFIYNQTNHIFTGSVSLSSTLNVTGATTLKDDTVITGSLRGNVNALSISSQTASLDCSTGNFYTLTLVSGSTTFVNPSNILPGQTINLRIKQASVASGSISFASSIKQVSGSAYVPTATANAEDIVTFIAFDSTNLYLSNVKNFV